MPMYGVVFSFKDPFDTKDMRITGSGDARYDIDFPTCEHVLVEQLRRQGAIPAPPRRAQLPYPPILVIKTHMGRLPTS